MVDRSIGQEKANRARSSIESQGIAGHTAIIEKNRANPILRSSSNMDFRLYFN